MKTVFSNSQLAHVWAQLKQPHGRSSGGSMRFDGSVAYSYAEPVAHIVKAPDGTLIALFTDRKWSVTTSSHVTDYRSAASHYKSFTVPDIFASRYHVDSTFDHSKNLASFKASYDVIVAELMRVPCDSYRVSDAVDPFKNEGTRAHQALAAIRNKCADYGLAFGISHMLMPRLPVGLDAAKIIARRDRLANDPKREAARLARQLAGARKAELERRLLKEETVARIAAWRKGAIVFLAHSVKNCPDGGAMIRVKEDTLQTSWGAEVPLADAIAAIRVWSYMMALDPAQRPKYAPPGVDKMQLGPYFTLDSIADDGTVRAGCHTFYRAELERFATSVGV